MLLRCESLERPMSQLGHERLGGASCRSSHVRYASDCYRNGEPLKLTRRANKR
jgi:hypothetical protein